MKHVPFICVTLMLVAMFLLVTAPPSQVVHAQFGRTAPWASSQSGLQILPTTNTPIPGASTAVVELDGGYFSNPTGTAINLTIVDSTTNCGGSPCQVFPTSTVAAAGVVAVNFGGLIVTGPKWSASGAGLQGFVKGRL